VAHAPLKLAHRPLVKPAAKPVAKAAPAPAPEPATAGDDEWQSF
jgi:hypothetical protein